MLIVLVFLFEALPEELVFRGYMQGNLEQAIGHWGAVLAQAVLFSVWVGLGYYGRFPREPQRWIGWSCSCSSA